jgi:CCR4-NOT transcription complex subunit 3
LELSYLPVQGQFRGRTEITPDQREKFLQKLQQVQQQGHGTILSMPPLAGGNHKQFSAQQQSPLLQQVLFLV